MSQRALQWIYILILVLWGYFAILRFWPVKTHSKSPLQAFETGIFPLWKNDTKMVLNYHWLKALLLLHDIDRWVEKTVVPRGLWNNLFDFL